MALYSLTQFISVLILYTVGVCGAPSTEPGPEVRALGGVVRSQAGSGVAGGASNLALPRSSCVA